MCCVLPLLPGPVAAAAAIEIRVEGDLIAVRAVDASIRRVLVSLAANGVLEVESAPPLDERVTMATRPERLTALLRRLLRAHSYELHRRAQAHPARLRILTVSGPGAVPAPIVVSAADRAFAGLSSPDPEVREEAVLTLADLGDPATIASLVGSLDDESPGVREAAGAALEDLAATALKAPGRLTGQDRQ